MKNCEISKTYMLTLESANKKSKFSILYLQIDVSILYLYWKMLKFQFKFTIYKCLDYIFMINGRSIYKIYLM